MLVKPMPAAAVAIPVVDVDAAVLNTQRTVKEVILDMLGAMIRNALNAFLGKLAHDAAVFIASGGEGQDALVFSKPPGEYMESLGDAAAGGAIEGLASGAGLDVAGLCDPGETFKVNLTFGLDAGNAKTPYKPACTLTELGSNWKEAYADADFNKFFELQFDPSANQTGVFLEAQDVTISATDAAEKDAEIKRSKGDFDSKTELVSKTILTPGSLIEGGFKNASDSTKETLRTVGKPFTDAINIFASTLVSKLMKRLQDGIANLSKGSGLAGIISGVSSGAATGRGAAEATFAELKQPTFAATGSFDILAELGSCLTGDDGFGPTVNNCAIGAAMQIAITEHWSVQEFINYLNDNSKQYRFADNNSDSASIIDDAAITYKGILLLKKYRIAPVGWQLAAEYINAKYASNIPTLQNLVDCYNACGGDSAGACTLLLNDPDGNATTYSPFCKLVDPQWVLKAPQNFCEREAPGPDFSSINTFETGTAAEQQAVQFSRLNYCADSRGCIEEVQEGVCTAYGYCTDERRIYRFAGESCQSEYSSCQTFSNEAGDTVSYLKSSLNYNDCATDPGCQWYCLSQNASGSFDCASPTETFVSCTEDTATDYGLTYDANEVCGCTLDRTCQVAAGSDLGFDGNTDSVYDYWQCEVANGNGTESLCELSSACGAGSPSYDPTTEQCTCTLSNTCAAAGGDNSCPVTVDIQGGGTTSLTCTLDNGASCTEDYSTYSNAPACEVTTGYLNCGDTCTVLDGQTSCSNSLGNDCVDGDIDTSDGDIDADGSVNGSCTLQDSCAIAAGLYACTSTGGNTCVIGTVTEEPAISNDTLYFDDNTQSCDSGDAGCQQYIRLKSDTNLIPNTFFEYYDQSQNNLDDTVQDFVAFCSHDGSGCDSSAACTEDINGDGDTADTEETQGQCIGWIQDDAVVDIFTSGTDTSFTSTVTTNYSTNYAHLVADGSGDGALSITVDTGQNVSNRTFTFAYSALSLDASTTTCDLSFSIGDANGYDIETVTSFTDASDATITSYSDSFRDYYVTHTFPNQSDLAVDLGSAITVSINEHANCAIDIEAATLVEADSFTNSYPNYLSNNATYLNGDTLRCEPADVGCELYVEAGRDEEEGIPGLITNAGSAACVDANGDYDYSNPSCNQCNGNPVLDQPDDYFVGCGFYQEIGLDNTTPITTDEPWLDNVTERPGVMQRYGGYCSNDSVTHCFADTDCVSGATCQLQLSIVPSSADQCGISAVGCEEYTNLDAAAQGGEGLEYYTDLKQCVKTNDTAIATFHTFEGSDDSGGVRINDYLFKVANDVPYVGAPCTQLDLQSEEFNADCQDGESGTTVHDCGPSGDLDNDGIANNSDVSTDDEEYGVNADCRQFLDDSGNIYYRYESEVIVVSDACIPLRNSQDTRVYYAIPNDSNSCAAAEVGCREYRGTDAGATEEVINETFASNSYEAWAGATSTSNEALSQGDYSLQLHDADAANATNAAISYNLFTTVDTETVGLLNAGSSYILTFWAKVDGGSCSDATYTTIADCTGAAASWNSGSATFNLDGLANDYYFTTSGASSTPVSVTLDPNGEGGWQYYQVGPVIVDTAESVAAGDETFTLQYTGGSAAAEAFIDTIRLTQSNSQYLIQDTANTCLGFEGCREYSDRSAVTHYLKSFQRLCDTAAVGCEAMIDTANSTNPFTEGYNLNNEYNEDDVIVPYDQPVTLVYDDDNQCSQTVYGCSEVGLPDVDERTGEILEYQSTYLLDRPDDYVSILCEQPQLQCRQYDSEYDGTVYFKDPGDKICELKEYTNEAGNTVQGWFKKDSAAASPDCPVQYEYADPSQPLGGVCSSNSVHLNDDFTVASSKVDKLCNSDADCYPTDWDSSDPAPRCLSNPADDVDVYNGGIHNYLQYVDDGVTLTTPDFGWVGQCPGEQSGCSEYVDPYSPNIAEVINNWSFEDDARDLDNVYYASDATPDGFPDYWAVPQNGSGINVDNDGDGIADDVNYSTVDLDLDGTTDFDSSCANDIIKAIETTAVAAADGAKALALTNCAVSPIKFHEFERDQLYTLQAMVKMPQIGFDDEDSTTDTPIEFSIGLQFFTNDTADVDHVADGITVDDSVTYIVANHATISDTAFEVDTDGMSKWYRWQGNIGLGSTIEWPGNAVYARAFVANHSATTMYFDAVSLKQNDKYYYLDYTVDGTSEKESIDSTNSCDTQDVDLNDILSDGGCVAFRDITYDTQSYAQDAQDCTTCLLTPNSDTCRNQADACDTNTVLKVNRDRVCSEWLACETAATVIDDQGNQSSQCYNINICNELDANGNCSSWVPKPAYDQLSPSLDIQYTSAKGDTDALLDMTNLTGYAKAGVTWPGTRSCQAGPYAGQLCDADSDCTDTCTGGLCVGSGISCSTNDDCNPETYTCADPFAVNGYYPYGWMYEIGESGASSGQDLIEHNDFETLYCAGSDADTTQPCITNATQVDIVTASPEAGNCFTSRIESRLQDTDITNDPVTIIAGDDVATAFSTDDDQPNPTYYCPNTPAFFDWPFGGPPLNDVSYTARGWQTVGTATVQVSQYDPRVPDCTDDCPQIDVNNVLEVEPQNEPNTSFTSGVEYDLSNNGNNIIPGGSYALSFEGRYDGNYAGLDAVSPSTLTICLNHNGMVDPDDTDISVERKDCFVSGYGAADIVFAIDTSSSMSGEINAVQQAIVDLADLLDASGVDARFALVDMDRFDLDGDGAADDDANDLDLDFTADVCDARDASNNCTSGTFFEAVDAMVATSALVDPFNAVVNIANNTLPTGESLSYRNDAQRFIIIVTDTGDEIGNDIGSAQATSSAQLASVPVYVISNGREACANDNADDAATGSPCSANYASLADASGGDVYDYTDPDDNTAPYATSSDWAGDTTIVDRLYGSILSDVEIFQMDSIMRTYTFGPITTTQLQEDNEAAYSEIVDVTTDLEFLASDNSHIQIDNVSLMPVLEVSKELDPITRSCRAYPESDALQCDYTQATGGVFKGWKGYCLEQDPTNNQRCISWWPQDILAGEESIVERVPSGYNGSGGRSNVYHCLVSKGLQEPGFCDEATWDTNDPITFGTGKICTNNDQCDSGECIQGANYTFPTHNDGIANTDNFDTEAAVTVAAFSAEKDHPETGLDEDNVGDYNEIDNGYRVRALRWQVPDVFDVNTERDYDHAMIARIPANEILRNIHISEIESIIYNTGSAGETGGVTDEYKYWGQLGYGADLENASVSPYDRTPAYPDDPTNCGSYDCSAYGNWVLTDFFEGSISRNDATGDYEPWNDCAGFDVEVPGFGCRNWGLYDSEFLPTYYEDQAGSYDNMDIVYNWAWSNFDLDNGPEESELLYHCEQADTDDEDKYLYRFNQLVTAESKPDMFASPCVEQTVKQVMGIDSSDGNQVASWTTTDNNGSRNPWNHVPGSVLNNIVENQITSEDYATYVFDEDDLGSWAGWDSLQDIQAKRGADADGGNNLFSLWLDVNEQGYIQAVYYLLYVGADGTPDTDRGVELTYSQHMFLDLQVRESCAVISQDVTPNGDNVAWASRAANGSDGYAINSQSDNPIQFGSDNSPYGSITTQDDTPLVWDPYLSVDPENFINLYIDGTFNYQPIVASSSAPHSGRPLSCIGKCDQRFCVNSFSESGSNGNECDDDGDCGDNGVCMGIGDAEVSAEGLADGLVTLASTYDTLDDQITGVVDNARERLKHVFADIAGDFYKLDFTSLTGTVYTNNGVPDYWDDGDGNIFADMSICTDADGNILTDRPSDEADEYCGILPAIASGVIAVDGHTAASDFADGSYDVEAGRTLEFQFTSTVNAEQTALDFIYIDWGDGNTNRFTWEAAPTTHIFTHAYNCGPEYAGYDIDGNVDTDIDGNVDTDCEFQPQITLLDHWNFCSGAQGAGDHRFSGDSTTNIGNDCGTYDTPSFNILVSTD
ncbi:MAG: VWA domain-containing protein [Candidatus Kerfeldbacteria bacterium]|nr:VWA domain-containing protein [Candidatus Kerfeldbacteria bacterium]